MVSSELKYSDLTVSKSYLLFTCFLGLNVYSMLKHNTLVLTERAARSIEEKILYQLHRPDGRILLQKFKLNQ